MTGAFTYRRVVPVNYLRPTYSGQFAGSLKLGRLGICHARIGACPRGTNGGHAVEATRSEGTNKGHAVDGG